VCDKGNKLAQPQVLLCCIQRMLVLLVQLCLILL
jgi:hypothetical protein